MDDLRAGEPILAGDVTLVPIERRVIEAGRGDWGCWLFGLKEPFAVIIRNATGVRAFNAEGTEIPFDSLSREVPELGAGMGPGRLDPP